MNRNGTASSDPTQARLKEVFMYVAGHLVYRTRRGPRLVGYSTAQIVPRPDGYTRLKVDSASYYLHRLVWIWYRGNIQPGVEVDHISGDRLDCRIENLRLATFEQNARNKGKPAGCSSRYVGVCASSHCPGKWSAYMRVYGKVRFFGTNHATEDQAYNARVAAEKKYHKEFATHKRKER